MWRLAEKLQNWSVSWKSLSFKWQLLTTCEDMVVMVRVLFLRYIWLQTTKKFKPTIPIIECCLLPAEFLSENHHHPKRIASPKVILTPQRQPASSAWWCVYTNQDPLYWFRTTQKTHPSSRTPHKISRGLCCNCISVDSLCQILLPQLLYSAVLPKKTPAHKLSPQALFIGEFGLIQSGKVEMLLAGNRRRPLRSWCFSFLLP